MQKFFLFLPNVYCKVLKKLLILKEIKPKTYF